MRVPVGLASLVCVASLLAWPQASTAQPPPGYYDSVDTTNSAALRATLHAVIDDHTRFPYTSSSRDTWDVLNDAQEDPNNSNNILDVYGNKSLQKISGGTGAYNREHTWPKSYGFPNDNSSNYPYTDCHMLHLCDSGYNSARSNHPYRTCSASCTEKPTDFNNGQGGGSGTYPGNSNWDTGAFTQGTWEVWNGRRGDIARAMFYADVRYEGGTHGVTGASEPDLILTDSESLIDASNTGSNESVAYMGMLAVLLQWHLEDPVDSFEQARNDSVFADQGNRNPFVDHPEWVDCLFDGICGCSIDPDCDDGLFCNGAETCVGGSCQAGTPVDCDDLVACTDDACNETTDSCDNVVNNANCDNGLFCDGAETCDPVLDCQGGTAVDCDDGVACTDDSCNEATDSCDNVVNDANCDNGLFCDGAETCDPVLDCQGGTAPDCDDGVACTDDSCNETTDSCDNVANDANCDNGLFCDGAETCDPVLDCQAGSEPCPGQICDEPTDTCNDCLTDGDCDDGLFCNGAETCVAGGCQAGTTVDCDDGVACTDDSCNEAADACDNIASDANCDDGLFCNGAEFCDPVFDCQAGGDPCPGQSCDEVNDLCTACDNDGTCDAGEDCDNCPGDCPSLGADPNNNICETAAGEDCITAPNDCNGKLNGNPNNRYCCGDGSAEYGVTCADARCTGDGNTCTDLPVVSSCCGDGVCEGDEDAANCAIDCAAGCSIPADCDDSDPCTLDDCVGGVCVNDPLDCDDADLCTTDSCSGGMCFNDPVDCDDAEACTIDSCDPGTGACDNIWPSCGPADGCCEPGVCDSGNDPDCACGGPGAACTQNGDCCSNKCKGNGTCK